MIQIAYDKDLPFIEAILKPFQASTLATPFTATTPKQNTIPPADILIIRSVTRINTSLLEHCSPKLIITATAGTDHIDTLALKHHNILLKTTHGSNAQAVTEYVLTAFFTFLHSIKKPLADVTVASIGCGSIGSRLVTTFHALGVNVIPYDPPLQKRLAQAKHLAPKTTQTSKPHSFMPHSKFSTLREADFISLHVPLTRTGAHPTHHLINQESLKTFAKTPWLVNTSRGAVCDEGALIHALKPPNPQKSSPSLSALVLDVWNHEPQLNPTLLNLSTFATPHIAGYSQEASRNNALKIYHHLTQFIETHFPTLAPPTQLPTLPFLHSSTLAPHANSQNTHHHTQTKLWNPITNQMEVLKKLQAPPTTEVEIIAYLAQLCQQTTFISTLTQKLKQTSDPHAIAQTFQTLRQTMRNRREWSAFTPLNNNFQTPALKQFLQTCGFQLT